MLNLSQLQAIKILETINLRFSSFKNSVYEIMVAIDENKIQFCKARRQGLDLIKDFDKYAKLANRIIAKHLNDVTNCKEIKDIIAVVSNFNEYKPFFQN